MSGLTELEVKDSEDVMTLLQRGNLRRTCEPTAVNKTSSRSHAILKVRPEPLNPSVTSYRVAVTGHNPAVTSYGIAVTAWS